MPDTITITEIHPAARKIVVNLNVEGKTYPTIIPILETQDAEVIKAQLQDLAQEVRNDFDTLTKAVQASDATASPSVSDAVNALVGQDIPVDTTPATPATPAAPIDGATPTP